MTRAREIHEAALVLDAHTDTLRRVVMDGVDLAERSAGDPLAERADLPRDRDGSVNAQIFAAWVDTIYLPDHAARRTSSFSVILDHIDHAVAVVGIDHVGIGTDLDVPPPEQARGVRRREPLSQGHRGPRREGIHRDGHRKILGENWLRVLEVVTGD